MLARILPNPSATVAFGPDDAVRATLGTARPSPLDGGSDGNFFTMCSRRMSPMAPASCWPMGPRSPTFPAPWTSGAVLSINGLNAFASMALLACTINPAVAGALYFPPHVAIHLVQMACERPEHLGRSLAQWDCAELAWALVDEGVVGASSAETVLRILVLHQLKPWRTHMWLNPKKPRDEAFYACIAELIVLSLDEKTSLQPRPRLHPTRPAKPEHVPNRVEHAYKRDGALHLFAAFDTRTGHVNGQCSRRKDQQEFISFLEDLDRAIPSRINLIHMVCDNVSVHHGKEVQTWLKQHPRFRFHFTPTHCSWMNQVEQWFSILQRKRFRLADFASKEDMQAKILQFIAQWNQHAHPCNWSTKSVARVMAEAPIACPA